MFYRRFGSQRLNRCNLYIVVATCFASCAVIVTGLFAGGCGGSGSGSPTPSPSGSPAPSTIVGRYQGDLNQGTGTNVGTLSFIVLANGTASGSCTSLGSAHALTGATDGTSVHLTSTDGFSFDGSLVPATAPANPAEPINGTWGFCTVCAPGQPCSDLCLSGSWMAQFTPGTR